MNVLNTEVYFPLSVRTNMNYYKLDDKFFSI